MVVIVDACCDWLAALTEVARKVQARSAISPKTEGTAPRIEFLFVFFIFLFFLLVVLIGVNPPFTTTNRKARAT